MPFAVGQVQDVGLIFLSAIASAVVDQCSAAGLSGADTLATALASLTTATFIVGVLIIGTGEAALLAGFLLAALCWRPARNRPTFTLS
jgi:SulP family sulfate permease